MSKKYITCTKIIFKLCYRTPDFDIVFMRAKHESVFESIYQKGVRYVLTKYHEGLISSN